MGRQPCKVKEVTDPVRTTLPMKKFDTSKNLKTVIRITCQSIFWPAIDYEETVVHHDDNRICTYSGKPAITKGNVVNGTSSPRQSSL